jgi:molecular chaperone GrpE
MRDDLSEPSGEPAAPSPLAPSPKPAEDWETRFKYLLADLENFRRRSERERESITRQVTARLLRELLPILEAFRSARAAVEELPRGDTVRAGLELLDREWTTFLQHEGVEPVARIGEPFRADETEAVGEAPAKEGASDGTVSEIVQQGYRCFGGLLRPAKVIVARASPGTTSEKSPEAPEESVGEKVP